MEQAVTAMQQEGEHMLQTTYVTCNPLEARQTSLHGEVKHKESWPSLGQVRLEEVCGMGK